MRISVHIFVSIIGFFLFAASVVSLYFALGAEQVAPLLLVAIVNILAVIVLIFLITRGIISPLSQIQSTIYKVGKGDFTTSIQVRSVKELQELADELNKMIGNIKKEQDAIEEAKTALEIRVLARTRELQELAQSLEEKVQARTKELQEKVQELERFQKLAVGRELQMIELKKQVEAMNKST